jgi:hypothetical protein
MQGPNSLVSSLITRSNGGHRNQLQNWAYLEILKISKNWKNWEFFRTLTSA